MIIVILLNDFGPSVGRFLSQFRVESYAVRFVVPRTLEFVRFGIFRLHYTYIRFFYVRDILYTPRRRRYIYRRNCERKRFHLFDRCPTILLIVFGKCVRDVNTLDIWVQGQRLTIHTMAFGNFIMFRQFFNTRV